MSILHCYLQYSMKFLLPRKTFYLAEKCCYTMIFWDKIDILKPVRMPYSLKNHVWKFNFCLKISYYQVMCFFLRYTHITILAQTDSTQLDHNFPMSWGNFRYLRFSGRFPSRSSAGHFMAPIAQNDPFWDRKMHFLSKIHFLEASSNFFVTIMTGYQNNNLFVSTTLLDGLLGGR